jgi:hypothetical protein
VPGVPLALKSGTGCFPKRFDSPVATSNQVVKGLSLGASGHCTFLQATIPVLPAGLATLVTWPEVLNQIGILAILALVFLLAHWLRSEVLFTAGSASIMVACGHHAVPPAGRYDQNSAALAPSSWNSYTSLTFPSRSVNTIAARWSMALPFRSAWTL